MISVYFSLLYLSWLISLIDVTTHSWPHEIKLLTLLGVVLMLWLTGGHLVVHITQTSILNSEDWLFIKVLIHRSVDGARSGQRSWPIRADWAFPGACVSQETWTHVEAKSTELVVSLVRQQLLPLNTVNTDKSERSPETDHQLGTNGLRRPRYLAGISE